MKNAEAPDVSTADGAVGALAAIADNDLPAQIRPTSSLQDISLANTPVGSPKCHCCDWQLDSIPPLQLDLPHSLLSQRPPPERARRLLWVEPTLMDWHPALASPGNPTMPTLSTSLQKMMGDICCIQWVALGLGDTRPHQRLDQQSPRHREVKPSMLLWLKLLPVPGRGGRKWFPCFLEA